MPPRPVAEHVVTPPSAWACLIAVGLLTFTSRPSRAADEFEREPINYSRATPVNAVSRLQTRLDKGQTRLTHDDHFGYLPAVLKELGVSRESQTLVFSKTSLQRQQISPRHPRSLYFNDDAYVGFCQDGELLELSVADPQLGTVFYTLEQRAVDRPAFVRQTDDCLLCHGASHTLSVPGHTLRSVFSDRSGNPILSSGSYRIDQTTPFEKRWGGWYVTGRHGKQQHLGNLVFKGDVVPRDVDNAAGQNVVDLSDKIDVEKFLTPHSDLVALLVLEHQTAAHNHITQASMQTRLALHQEAALNRELKEPPNHRWNSTNSRIKSAGEALVRYLLFVDEAPLTEPVSGTSQFAAEFAKLGPRDPQGRSLRDFDLTRRVFKYPCSYLVYSESFDALPGEMRDFVWRRLWDVLHGADPTTYRHLTPTDRTNIRDILLATKPNLPAYWQAAGK